MQETTDGKPQDPMAGKVSGDSFGEERAAGESWRFGDPATWTGFAPYNVAWQVLSSEPRIWLIFAAVMAVPSTLPLVSLLAFPLVMVLTRGIARDLLQYQAVDDATQVWDRWWRQVLPGVGVVLLIACVNMSVMLMAGLVGVAGVFGAHAAMGKNAVPVQFLIGAGLVCTTVVVVFAVGLVTCFAIDEAVVAREGVMDALSNSYQMVRRAPLEILGHLLLWTLGNFVLFFAVTIVLMPMHIVAALLWEALDVPVLLRWVLNFPFNTVSTFFSLLLGCYMQPVWMCYWMHRRAVDAP